MILILLMVIYIVENQCFACFDYFKLLARETHIEIEIDDNFKKSSFHNRYVIAGANGLINLSVPVVGGREQKTNIANVEIDYNSNWSERHWRSIASAYRKAPFFDYYSSQVKEMLFSGERSLLKFNVSNTNILCKLLSISRVINFTSAYRKTYSREIQGVVDYRNRFSPATFQSISNDWQPRYSQVFEDRLGFQPNLSILDLLFCEGPNAKFLLNTSSSAM
ncbi:MAG: WbqC family protein [Bacteroidota bacterium]|nr:WbqC family protein [Bacteroidota bacterium]